MSRLNGDTLFLIFEGLQDDSKSLFSRVTVRFPESHPIENYIRDFCKNSVKMRPLRKSLENVYKSDNFHDLYL